MLSADPDFPRRGGFAGPTGWTSSNARPAGARFSTLLLHQDRLAVRQVFLQISLARDRKRASGVFAFVVPVMDQPFAHFANAKKRILQLPHIADLKWLQRIQRKMNLFQHGVRIGLNPKISNKDRAPSFLGQNAGRPATDAQETGWRNWGSSLDFASVAGFPSLPCALREKKQCRKAGGKATKRRRQAIAMQCGFNAESQRCRGAEMENTVRLLPMRFYPEIRGLLRRSASDFITSPRNSIRR